MLMSIPIWITYALIVPGFLLTCLVALVDVRRRLADRGTGGGDE
jgi:TRAP-type C4-dicarboxylate transport system permease small subunit